MTEVRNLRRWRLAAILAGLAVLVTTVLFWTTERRRAGLHDEVRWLRGRLAERREQVGRMRMEMSEVADAVQRVAWSAATVRERAAQARRLAHMEESRDQLPDVSPVRASLDSSAALVSEETARALDQLAWLEAQTAAAGDSFTVLTVLMRDRDGSRDDRRSSSPPSFWPVRGLVTSPFGLRRSPWDGERELHPGIDILARYGMPVVASGDGKVIFAGRESGYGGLVIVSHAGSVDTFYAHLSALYVHEGQRIRRGQPIGAVGATGRATGAHLHYEVRVGGRPVDPSRYLASR